MLRRLVGAGMDVARPNLSIKAAQKRELIAAGDVVIITAGAARSKPGTTNLMRVRVVE